MSGFPVKFGCKRYLMPWAQSARRSIISGLVFLRGVRRFECDARTELGARPLNEGADFDDLRDLVENGWRSFLRINVKVLHASKQKVARRHVHKLYRTATQ
jgi:hypothetical protein